jgi:dTDP-4-dehydrorhamnose 3,5-epimerase
VGLSEPETTSASAPGEANGGRPSPGLAKAVKLQQTVTSESKPIKELIDGVKIREATTHPDDRGTLCEIYNPAWGFTDDPLVYVYQITIRPQQIKGWVVHMTYDDRLFFAFGTTRVVLYDDREDSPTRGRLNEQNPDKWTLPVDTEEIPYRF